jgi:nicotinamidase-related amidase
MVGTSANDAILYTGTGAALRNYKVIVPVDGISSVDTLTLNRQFRT